MIFASARDLPTFSSNAIELSLFRIPGLSECFFMLNDDMFWNNPVVLSDYFNFATQRQVVRESRWMAPMEKYVAKNSWHQSIAFADELIKKKFGRQIKNRYPEHGCYFFQKTFLKQIAELWPGQVARTVSLRYRSRNSLTVPFVHMQLAKILGNATLIFDYKKNLVTYAKVTDSSRANRKTFANIHKKNKTCICLNDGFRRPRHQTLSQLKQLFVDIFPTASQYERDRSSTESIIISSSSMTSKTRQLSVSNVFEQEVKFRRKHPPVCEESPIATYINTIATLPISGICANALLDISCHTGRAKDKFSACRRVQQNQCFLLFQVFPSLTIDCLTFL
jgi:hypothetical protein